MDALLALFQPLWLFAGLIAAVLRLLILSKSPPKPINVWQRLRDAAISFILVAFSPGIVAAYDISITAMHLALAIAVLGPEQTFRIIKKILFGFLHTIVDSDQTMKNTLLNAEQKDAYEKEKKDRE